MEEDVPRDRVLATHAAEHRARLLRVQAEVMNQVALDHIEARLVAPAAVDPVGGRAIPSVKSAVRHQLFERADNAFSLNGRTTLFR